MSANGNGKKQQHNVLVDELSYLLSLGFKSTDYNNTSSCICLSTTISQNTKHLSSCWLDISFICFVCCDVFIICDSTILGSATGLTHHLGPCLFSHTSKDNFYLFLTCCKYISFAHWIKSWMCCRSRKETCVRHRSLKHAIVAGLISLYKLYWDASFKLHCGNNSLQKIA